MMILIIKIVITYVDNTNNNNSSNNINNNNTNRLYFFPSDFYIKMVLAQEQQIYVKKNSRLSPDTVKRTVGEKSKGSRSS